MRIIVDPQIFWLQRFGGISRVVVELMLFLRQQQNVHISCPLGHHQNEVLKAKGLLKISSVRKISEYNNPLGRLIKKILPTNAQMVSRALTRDNYDIFVPTYYDTYFLRDLKMPYVLIVHDMIHEIYADRFKDIEPFVAENKKKLMYGAETIIAVSENTKKDILKFYEDLPTPIEVMHLAYSPPEQVRHFENRYGGYLLFIGNRSLYKNFRFMVDALSPVLLEHNLQLLCVGSQPFQSSEKGLFEDLGIELRVHHLSYDETTISSIYAQAIAFIFPSEYEGFGLPILESFANDCPAILAEASCFPEVAGDAALYFQLGDPGSLGDCVTRLLSQPELRDHYVQQGRERLKGFTWKHSGEIFLDALKRSTSGTS